MSKLKQDIRSDCAIWYPEYILGRKWNISIILELIHAKKYPSNSMSYTDITELLPEISSRTLSRRLKELSNLDIIKVHENKKLPKKVRYSLTQSGKDLIPIIKSMRDWSLKHGNTDNPKCINDECRHSKEISSFLELEEIKIY